MIHALTVLEVRSDAFGGTDKLYVLEPWPRQARFYASLIGQADIRRLERVDDKLSIRCDNGTADYRITNYDYIFDAYETELIEGVWESPPP